MAFEKMNRNDKKRPEGRNMVMVYGFSETELASLQKLSKQTGISEVLYIDEEIAKQKVKSIIDQEKNQKDQEVKEKEKKVIVFNAVSQEELHHFLDGLSVIGKERPLVAMVTPTSRTWTFEQLVNELSQEREALG